MTQQQTDLLRQAADLYPVATNPGMPLVELDRADFSFFERNYSQYQSPGIEPVEELSSSPAAPLENIAFPDSDRVTPALNSNYATSGSFAQYLFSQSPVVELLAMQRDRMVGEPVAPSLELQLWILQHGLDIMRPRA